MQVTGSERRLERAIARRWLALVALVAACVLAAPAAAAAQSVTVTVDIAGTGSGTVTSSPSGINCSGSNTSCAAGFTGGAAVTLTATATSGHTFLGWTGICSGTGTCQFNAVDGALAVAQFDSPTAAAVTYYHLDAIGSVRALTDGSGNVLIRHDYFPFGEDAQAMTGDPLRFTGQEIDAESDQHYFQARQYRQIWGRFTTVDPGHVNGSLEDPQGWNGYAYARNNPLAFVDPNGRTYIRCIGEDCIEMTDDQFEDYQAYPGPDVLLKDGKIFASNGETIGSYLQTSIDGTPLDGFQRFIDLVSIGLDAGGLPPLATLADLFNGAISAARGDWWGAGASTLAMAPYIGVSGNLARLGRWATSVSQYWGNPRTLLDHFKRHGPDFGAGSPADYVRMSVDFLSEAQRSGFPTKIDSDGVIRAYDPSSNTFGAYNPDGTARTFFNPHYS